MIQIHSIFHLNPPPDPSTDVHACVYLHDLQRILNADYNRETPAYLGLSDECKDIISKILVAPPTERITIQDILRHPW